MVAIIKTGHSIRNILNYNENKVKQADAVCIGEGNYPMDVDKMNFDMKLNRLSRQAALNGNVSRNSVHISLNFDPSEASLPKEKLMDIANSYMDKIGFGSQPYLVYQHHDAAHPHIHIVSIKITEDGSRIDTQNIGRNQSEAARKEIEKSFGLVVAQGRRKAKDYELQPISVNKVQYGRIQSKKAISNVLSAVLNQYKFSSLPELNAVLGLYNVMADRGSENSRMFRGNGLVYRILGSDGKPVGVPIKASDFYNRPTMAFLQDKFTANKSGQLPLRSRVRHTIDLALLNQKPTIAALTAMLAKEGVAIVLRKNEQGRLYGITYVDHVNKCVFNGSSLGKAYSAKAIENRCAPVTPTSWDPSASGAEKIIREAIFKTSQATRLSSHQTPEPNLKGNLESLSEMVLNPEHAPEYNPGPPKGKRRRKKRKGLSGNN